VEIITVNFMTKDLAADERRKRRSAFISVHLRLMIYSISEFGETEESEPSRTSRACGAEGGGFQ
jgi:hypothetical protein